MHEVEHGRRAGERRERLRVARRGGGEVGRFDRHRVHVAGGSATCASRLSPNVREVAVGVAGRRDALVDLEQVHVGPVARSRVASARSICHGVWPPLTANLKRPRAAIAARRLARR